MSDEIIKPEDGIICPICGQRTTFVEKKKLLGKSQLYVCSNENCLTKLAVKRDLLLLNDTKNKNSDVWKTYGQKKLALREWKRIAEGGMSDEEQASQDRITILEGLKTAEITFKLTNEVPIILKKNEEPYLWLPNIQLHEDRMIRKRVGGAVRVMKGVYVGTSRSESHPQRRHIDTGELTLTNKRLVFVGNSKSVNIDLRKILSIDPYSDGISLSRSNKKNVEWFIGNLGVAKIETKIEDREYKFEFDGLFLKYMIEGLVSKLE